MNQEINPVDQREFERLLQTAVEMLSDGKARGCIMFAVDHDTKTTRTGMVLASPPVEVAGLGALIGKAMSADDEHSKILLLGMKERLHGRAGGTPLTAKQAKAMVEKKDAHHD